MEDDLELYLHEKLIKFFNGQLFTAVFQSSEGTVFETFLSRVQNYSWPSPVKKAFGTYRCCIYYEWS
jgi:hypothetical protein